MNHRSAVGPEELYDVIGGQQFCVLLGLGMREYDNVVDLGCGSLRGSQYIILFLEKNRWTGIEPNKNLVDDGILYEIGKELWERKMCRISYRDDFMITETGDRYYNFVLAQSILTHCGQDLVRKILRQAYLSLRMSGQIAATFFEGPLTSEHKAHGWLGNGVATYPEYWMRERCLSAGFREFKVLRVAHPMNQTWFSARK